MDHHHHHHHHHHQCHQLVPKCIVVMGVSGCGKTTIGERLAVKLGAHFEDADQYHSADSKAKMAKGIALTDEDRHPWLLRLAKLVTDSTGPIVLACSALKQKYRAVLTSNLADDYAFIHLDVSRKELEKRLLTRSGHFVDCKLLDSQLATLEKPFDEKNCFIIDADQSIGETVQSALKALKSLRLL